MFFRRLMLKPINPLYCVWFMMCLIIVPLTARADGPIVIGSTEIPEQLTKRGESNGQYDQLLAMLTDISLVFAPYSRIEVLFEREQVDCLFPASTVTMSNKAGLIESLPFIQSPAYVFSQFPYNSINEFAGKSIAIRRGVTAGGIRDTLPAEYIDLDSEQALVQFLALRRADAFIAYLTDVEAIYRDIQRPLDFYASDKPVFISQEAFVCHNNEKNKQFIARANKRIQQFYGANH